MNSEELLYPTKLLAKRERHKTRKFQIQFWRKLSHKSSIAKFLHDKIIP